MIQKGNILMVKGIAGNENDVVLYNQAIADLKNCPQHPRCGDAVRPVGQRHGEAVVSQYLASHPQPLAGAIQDGGMIAGVVSAFQAKGLKVPTVADGECYGGDLSWWLCAQVQVPDVRRLLQRVPGRVHLHERRAPGACQQGTEVQRARDAGGRRSTTPTCRSSQRRGCRSPPTLRSAVRKRHGATTPA